MSLMENVVKNKVGDKNIIAGQADVKRSTPQPYSVYFGDEWFREHGLMVGTDEKLLGNKSKEIL